MPVVIFFFKPVYFFQTSSFFLNQLIFFKPGYLSTVWKRLSSFGVWWKIGELYSWGGLKTINTEKLRDISCPYLPTIFLPFPSPSPLLPSSYIFVKMCKFQAEQKSVTSNVKLVKQPMQAPTFLHMIEIDLRDFRKCPCECIESHTWAMNITDHHTKHVTLYPLTAKSGEKVLQALQEYCFTYGYPRNILCDNSKEFSNKNFDTFCLNNGITIKHGSPRTPLTQGLIERSNRSCKEDMHTCIVSTAG